LAPTAVEAAVPVATTTLPNVGCVSEVGSDDPPERHTKKAPAATASKPAMMNNPTLEFFGVGGSELSGIRDLGEVRRLAS
jgi:hypothetical protein